MLHTLHVRNLAIVEQADITFTAGLNVLTGETGAGKSVLVGALDLLLGERADTGLIRQDADRCSVEAAFRLEDTQAVDALLDGAGLAPCRDATLIVRRVLTPAGSRAFVNDAPVAARTLQELGRLLVDMHGPHDHQSLFDRGFQLGLLDAAGQLADRHAAYAAAYAARQALLHERAQLDGDDRQIAQQLDMLRFQVAELREADVEALDEEALEQEHARIANAALIVECGRQAAGLLCEQDASAFDTLAQARRALDPLRAVLPEAEAWRDELTAVAGQVQELAAAIRTATEHVDCDPGRLRQLEDRKALLHRLKRKYGAGLEEVRQFYARAQARLHELENREARLAVIDGDIARADGVVREAGGVLSAARRKAADKLARAITAEIRALGFKHGALSIRLEPAEPGPTGIDAVEFMFAPNAGEKERPLRAIASSGEISRVMLAIKTVLAAHDRIPVLVFDEIDANVGGETANAVGGKLAAVARRHQVLCITHLPQVAVCGRTHFVVSKTTSAGRTRTRIEPVEQEARVEEVARMLGGRDRTSVTLQHARELLAGAGGAPARSA